MNCGSLNGGAALLHLWKGTVMKVEFAFATGDVLRDKITGYKGTVIGVTFYLNGCKRYCMQPKMTKAMADKGELPEGEWFDEEQLEAVGKKVATGKSNTGGPKSCTAPPSHQR